MHPILTIATVVKDNPLGLKSTGNSIVNQITEVKELFGHNIAWIIINGGHKGDPTDEVIQKFGAHVTYHQSKRDGGLYDAMNIATDVAQHSGSQYIWMLNGGDTAKDGAVAEIFMAATKAPDLIYSDGTYKDRVVPAGQLCNDIRYMPLAHQATVYHLPTLGALRYDTSYKIAADYKLTHDYLKNVKKAHYLQKPICRFEGGGLSEKRWFLTQMESFRVRQESKSLSLTQNIAFTARGVLSSFAANELSEPVYNALRSVKRAIYPSRQPNVQPVLDC